MIAAGAAAGGRVPAAAGGEILRGVAQLRD